MNLPTKYTKTFLKKLKLKLKTLYYSKQLTKI